MQFVLSIALLALTIFVLVDIITSDEWRIKNLNKFAWVIIVILLPLIGSILWFVIGKDYDRPVDHGSFGDPRRSETLRPLVIEDEQAAIENEIAYHEKQAQIRRLEEQLRSKREGTD